MQVKRIASKESQRVLGRLSQLLMQAPVPVRIKEYFPEENMATLQMLASTGIGSRGAVLKDFDEDTKFPILGPCHENISRGIKPGHTIALLTHAGFQQKKGFLQLAATAGLPETPLCTPIRHSWAVS